MSARTTAACIGRAAAMASHAAGKITKVTPRSGAHATESIPDGIHPAFSLDSHHIRSKRMQLWVVWHHRLIGETEGLALITDTACTATYCRFPSWHSDNYCDAGGSRHDIGPRSHIGKQQTVLV